MPLLEGSSKKIISQNIKEMVEHGHPEDVAIASAYAKAGKKNGKAKKCYYCGHDLKKKTIEKSAKFKSLLKKHKLFGNEKELLKACLHKFVLTRNFDFLFLARQINERGE